MHLHLLMRPRILQGEFCSCCQTLSKDDRPTSGVDRLRHALDRFGLVFQVNKDRYT